MICCGTCPLDFMERKVNSSSTFFACYKFSDPNGKTSASFLVHDVLKHAFHYLRVSKCERLVAHVSTMQLMLLVDSPNKKVKIS